jgi:hypothetical protein
MPKDHPIIAAPATRKLKVSDCAGCLINCSRKGQHHQLQQQQEWALGMIIIMSLDAQL